jgi:ankyrin repeat protein
MRMKANANAFDLTGRTPLYIAAKAGNLRAVKILLAFKANPMYKMMGRYSSAEVAKTEKIKSYINKAQLVRLFYNPSFISAWG